MPSVVWNAVIRARGLPEYLCLTCIVEAFGGFGQSFSAELIGGPFHDGLLIEILINSEAATDAAKVSRENTALRAALTRAVETIRAFHGIGLGPAEAEVWRLYQESPEMIEINAALAKATR